VVVRVDQCGRDGLRPHHPPGGIVGVGEHAVVDQVAPRIPSVHHVARFDQAVGRVAGIGGHGGRAEGRRHRGAVAVRPGRSPASYAYAKD